MRASVINWKSAAVVLGVSWILPEVGFAQDLPGGAEPGRVSERFEEVQSLTVQARDVTGLESTIPPEQASAIKLKLDTARIEGSTVYSDKELAELTSGLLGQTVTLAQVFEIAASITAKYGEDGYVLSRAIVPPQTLNPNGASIKIQILEGYVDEVRWPSKTSVSPKFLDQYARRITGDRPLNIETLERNLLLANDIPGVRFESNLVASQKTPGASTLIVTAEEERHSGFVSVSNHGVEASGPVQLTVGGTFNNYLGWNERISAEATLAGPADSGGAELLYFSFGYDQVLNADGLTLFVDGNLSRGAPGTAALAALDYETEGRNISGGLTFPFVKTREKSLVGTLAFEARNSKSYNLGTLATEDRLRIVRASVNYDFADAKGGQNQIAFEVSKGIEGLGSTSGSNPLASRSPGEVDFTKTTLDLARTQQLGKGFSLYGHLFGQWTDDPLLSSQECGFGGRTFGFGFENSVITGDTCAMISLELRKNVAVPASVGDWVEYAQVYGVIDYGKIWNISPPLGTPAQDDASSLGLGLRFGGGKYSAEFAVSKVLSAPASQPDVRDTRAWFKATMQF